MNNRSKKQKQQEEENGSWKNSPHGHSIEAKEMSSGFNNRRLADQRNDGVKSPIAVIQ